MDRVEEHPNEEEEPHLPEEKKAESSAQKLKEDEDAKEE